MRASATRRRVLGPAAGVLLAAAAVAPPMHAAAETSLAAHMVQHLVLILAAAPLLALGRPVGLALRGLPRRSRREVARRVHRLGVTAALPALAVGAWITHVVVLWAWHAPRLYDWAIANPAGHALEHLSLIVTAYAFWSAALNPRILGPGGAALYLFAGAGQGTALGALLVLTDTPWYPAYATSAAAWGLTPLQDQQLAGLIMWIPGGLVYAGGALAIVAHVFRDATLPTTRGIVSRGSP